MEKMAQLDPVVSRQGMDVGRGSFIVIAAAIAGPITCRRYG